MSRIIQILILSISIAGCTTSRWVNLEDPAPDLAAGRVVDSYPVVTVKSMPTPDNPILSLSVVEHRVLQVPLKFRSERMIQRYRPRVGLLALGVITSAGLVYLSTTDVLTDKELTDTQKNILRISALGILTASALHMQPVGDPIATGEVRLVGDAGSEQRTDSVVARSSSEPLMIRLDAAHSGNSLASNREFRLTGSTDINLIDELNLRQYQPDSDEDVHIRITSEHDILEIKIPMEALFSKYALVRTSTTALRSAPSASLSSVITTVAASSLLPWTNSTDTGWHRVLLGLTPTYVSKDDVDIVWRSPFGGSANLVVGTGAGSYGTLDIERNIPETGIRNNRSMAIIISNEYTDETIQSVKNGHRTARMVADYLKNSLGYNDERIVTLIDFSTYEEFYELLDVNLNHRTIAGRSISGNTDIFLYVIGAGSLVGIEDEFVPVILPVHGSQNEAVSIPEFIGQFTEMPIASINAVFELDFRNMPENPRVISRNQFISSVRSRLSDTINYNLIFSSEPVQQSGNYHSADLRTDRVHGILTYYFIRAIQDGATNTGDINELIRRNVSFTSRRLHNRAQDPVFINNNEFNLLRFTPEF